MRKSYLLFLIATSFFSPLEFNKFLIFPGTGISASELISASWAGLLVMVRFLLDSSTSGSTFSLTAVTMFCSKNDFGRIVFPSSSIFFGIVSSVLLSCGLSASGLCLDFLTVGMGISLIDSMLPSCRGVLSYNTSCT